MKKITLSILLSLSLCFYAKAAHITGGEFFYRYLGPGAAANTDRYEITLRLFRDCASTGAALINDTNNPYRIGIFKNSDNTQYPGPNSDGSFSVIIDGTVQSINITPSAYPCISPIPQVCYQIGYYKTTVDLPKEALGYKLVYQTCCRINVINNIPNNGPSMGGTQGATYLANIPGTNDIGLNGTNSSPVFEVKDTALICENSGFTLNFTATDPDGDSLSYSFCDAYGSGSIVNASPANPNRPPYNFLTYNFGYSGTRPLGSSVNIDPKTGIISGFSPAAGNYVISVCIAEWRGNKIISEHRKDFIIKIGNCSIAAADLQPEYITCDGFNLTFFNRSNSPLIRSYYWDFGLPGVTTDTSNLDRPNFTFPDTGSFRVMLITNRGEECSDTAYTIAKVYPGFFPAFSTLASCKGLPMQFNDNTTTRYGVVNKWRWSFGYPQVNPDTSILQNPQYIYPNSGTYQVRFIVSNSKGCIDTVDQAVQVLDKPTIQVTNDTLICSIDTLQLNAVGLGSFTWSPNYNINNINSASPLVSPDVPTKYYATLTAAPGCSNIDSVFVDVKQFVTLDAGPDTTICLTDTVRLNPQSDALSYRWTPINTLSDPNIKNPVATPTGAATTYTVIGNIGKCQAFDAVTIRAVPYPAIVASNDTAICYGDTAFLFASGGINYLWTPSSGLSSTTISNPIANPLVTTAYRVAVTDNLGCPKPSFDTVVVNVVPPVPAFAGRDTAIVVGQPLQLNASGGDAYVWAPPTGLSNPNIGNPVALLNDSITYIVRVSTEEGCFAFDTINVVVFQTDPDIFVPTAFTPNGDGLNDLLRPIPVGITNIEYFRVYNRWGEMVYSSNSEQGGGWNGRINGKDQGSDTYVWYVKGTDYTGKVIFKKGTATLIR